MLLSTCMKISAAKTAGNGPVIISFESINDAISMLILLLLAVSTLIQVMDMCGLLPDRFRRWLKLNRSQDTLEILRELGININQYKKHNAVVDLPRDYASGTIEQDTLEKLESIKIKKMVSIGRTRQTKVDYYIDLIGYSCDPKCAEAYARLLSSHWANVIETTQTIKTPNIDFIVTPKEGSPILGYEFAKLIGKPLVLHESSSRFESGEGDMRARFDCALIPKKGSTALIVDDSTTGGRMVLSTIADLKRYGYNVTECLVVFEPCNKDARKKLNDQGVNLISIVRTHKRKKVSGRPQEVIYTQRKVLKNP